MNDELLVFVGRHRIDWYDDIPGCETCGYGQTYSVNCACGWHGDGSDEYNAHLEGAARSWVGSGQPIFSN